MTREEYLARRSELMNQAQNQINAGELDASEETMNQVRSLDDQWDATTRAQANMNALAGEARPVNVQTGVAPNGVVDRTDGEQEITAASDVYRDAWAMSMMGRNLSADQQRAYDMVNEVYTHTTGNTGVVIPQTVATGIWEQVGEMYPYWADVAKTYVTGTLKLIQEETSSDAKWVEEEKSNDDGKETFGELILNGQELSRSITVSWKLREMAMEDFIPYIQRKLAKKMGAALGYGATHGTGVNEPTGVVTMLESEEGTPQIVTYTAAGLTYKNVTSARARVKSGYGAGLAVYANSETIWNELANVVDGNKRPMFVANAEAGGVGRVLGMIVKEDDSMRDGEILFSNAGDGYSANVNKQMTITTEEHVKDRKCDYCGYAIVDGTPVTDKAHALLKYGA